MTTGYKEVAYELSFLSNRLKEYLVDWQKAVVEYHEHGNNGCILLDINIINTYLVEKLDFILRKLEELDEAIRKDNLQSKA